MSTLGFPQLHQVSGAIDTPKLNLDSLKTADEVAQMIRMSTSRIRELTDAYILPHFRIDGGEPLFHPASLKRYIARHLTVACQGTVLPLRPIVLQPASSPVPLALTMIRDELCECPSVDVACVYFLIQDLQVVYVGQTRDLHGRLSRHLRSGKRWQRALFLPALERDLVQMETEWIEMLKPPLNRTPLTKKGAL